MIWIVAAGLGAFAALAYAATRMLYRASRQLRNGAALRAEFFEAALALAEDPATPRELVERVRRLAERIDDPRVGRRLLRRALSGRLRAAVESPDARFLAGLDALAPAARDLVCGAAASFLLAATFSNFLLGSVLRRAVLFWVRGVRGPAAALVADLEAR